MFILLSDQFIFQKQIITFIIGRSLLKKVDQCTTKPKFDLKYTFEKTNTKTKVYINRTVYKQKISSLFLV